MVVIKSVANFLLEQLFTAVSLGQLWICCCVLSEVILSAVQYTFSFSPLPKLLPGFPTSHMHLIRIFDITPSQQTVLYVPA